MPCQKVLENKSVRSICLQLLDDKANTRSCWGSQLVSGNFQTIVIVFEKACTLYRGRPYMQWRLGKPEISFTIIPSELWSLARIWEDWRVTAQIKRHHFTFLLVTNERIWRILRYLVKAIKLINVCLTSLHFRVGLLEDVVLLWTCGRAGDHS